MNANLIQLGISSSRADISTGAVLSRDNADAGDFEQVFREVKEVSASQSLSSAKPRAKERGESKETAPLASQKSKTEKTDNKKEIARSRENGDDTTQVSTDAQTAAENPQPGEEETLKEPPSAEVKNIEEAESQADWNAVQLSLTPINFTPVITEDALNSPQNVVQITGSEGALQETPNIQTSMNAENAAKNMEDAMLLALDKNASSDNPLFTENQTMDSAELEAFLLNSGKIQSSEASNFSSGGTSAEGLTEGKNPDLKLSNIQAFSDTESLPRIQDAQGPNSEINISQEPNEKNVSSLLSAQEKKGVNNAMDKVPNTGENSTSGQTDLADSSKSAKSSSESLSMKPAIQSIGIETPKEIKSAGNEKNSAFSASKSSGHNSGQSFAEASSFQNAGENGVNDQASPGNKSPFSAEASPELGNGKFDLPSLLSNENTASGTKGPNAFNLPSSGMSETRMQDLSHTSFLKTGNTVDWKPQEVFDRSVVDQIVSKATLISKNGQNEMRIQLDPPSLGTVKVQITVEGEKVSANVLADNSIARDIIERNIHHLRNSLSEQGLKVEHMSVNVGNDPKQPGAGQERPFFMEKEFSQKNPPRDDGYDKSEPALVSSTKNNFNRDGGISIFI